MAWLATSVAPYAGWSMTESRAWPLFEVDGVQADAGAGNHLHALPQRVDPGLVEQLAGDHDRVGSTVARLTAVGELRSSKRMSASASKSARTASA